MMEKQNAIMEKKSAGDACDIDDIVDLASNKMSKVHKTDPKHRAKSLADFGEPVPCDHD